MSDSIDDALIAKYLKKELSEEQESEFQKRVKNSKDFARRVKDELTMLNIVRTKHKLDTQLEYDLNQLELEEDETTSADDELVIKYAVNELSDEEIRTVEDRRKNDLVFDKKIKEHLQRMEAYYEYTNYEYTKSKEPKDTQNKKGNIKPLYSLLLAASIIVGILLSWFFYQQTRALDTKEIVAEYFKEDIKPLLGIVTRSTSSSSGSVFSTITSIPEELINNIKSSYASKHYQEFIKHLQKVNISATREELKLYEGIAYLELEQYDKAIDIFKEIIENPLKEGSSDFYYAHWYLSKIYLKNEDLENAKKHLKIVVNNPKDIKIQKASEILKLLD